MDAIPTLNKLLTYDLDTEQQLDLLSDLTLDKITSDVLAEAVFLFRDHMHQIHLPREATDMAGTGGDKSNTFNISTTSAIVAAAAGTPIAKHGNVSISSKSGGVDLLRALNIPLPDTANKAAEIFAQQNCVFLFAQKFHPIFKKFIPARKTLAAQGIITIFNVLGPLLNPAIVKHQICGVFKPELVPLMAETLLKTSTKRALIVYGNGLDEFSLTGENQICELKNGLLDFYTKPPEDFGFAPCTIEDLAGGLPHENAAITEDILSGKITDAKRDIVNLNAAAAIYVNHKDMSFKTAIETAHTTLVNGSAFTTLESLTS